MLSFASNFPYVNGQVTRNLKWRVTVSLRISNPHILNYLEIGNYNIHLSTAPPIHH